MPPAGGAVGWLGVPGRNEAHLPSLSSLVILRRLIAIRDSF